MSHKTRNNDMVFVLLTAMWSAKGVDWSILVPLIFFVGAGSLRILWLNISTIGLRQNNVSFICGLSLLQNNSTVH